MNRTAVRAAIHVAAVFAIYLSVAMLIPAATDLYYGNKDWRVFAFSALFMGGLAMAVALATQGRPPQATTRFGFLLVNLLWLTLAIAGAVPFMASSLNLGFADAFFELSRASPPPAPPSSTGSIARHPACFCGARC